MKVLSYILLIASVSMTTSMEITEVERIAHTHFNKTTTDDCIEIKVKNRGIFPQIITYYLYVPKNLDILNFKSEKREISSIREVFNQTTLEPLILTHDHLFNDEQLSGMSKITLNNGEISEFQSNYELINNDESEKQVNSFLIVIELNGENLEQLAATISSANFGRKNYPNESRHRWLIRCPPGYFIKLNVTSYQVERNFEEVLLYDATNGGNSLVGEITSLGEFATTSSELILVFKSDCEVTGKGFQAIVEFSERVIPTTASYVPTTEQTTIIPTSASNYVPTTEQTTIIPTSTSNYVPTTEQTTIIPTPTSNYVPTTEPTTEITTDSNPAGNASNVLEAIRRDVLSSDIWEKYNNTLNFESYKYRYDATRNNYSIADGGRDMYDRGNRVSFSVINGAHSYSENTTIYGELYSNRDVDAAYTSIKSHPFISLLWVGEANLNESFVDATLTVTGNAGADGEGSYSAQTTEQLYYGNSTLHTANFQVYNEPYDDPSICEVYAVVARESWNSQIIGTPTFSHGTSTNDLHNTFRITGKNFLVVYILLSDGNQNRLNRETINNFLATIYEFGSSVEV